MSTDTIVSIIQKVLTKKLMTTKKERVMYTTLEKNHYIVCPT